MDPGKRVLSVLLPPLQDILFVATLGGAFLLGARMLGIDSDLGRHLALGRYILSAGIIPTTDLFSHTMVGAERPPYEWLTQVLFALIERLAGLDGIILLISLLIALSFAFIYVQAARRSGLPLISLFITTIAIAASSLHWLPRPHVITFLFLALWLERLESVQCGGKVSLWQFPALMLFWANMHGGFIFGFLTWLAYLSGWGWERWIKKNGSNTAIRRQLWNGFLLSGIASFLTPGGWGNWKAVLSNHSRYILSQTLETMPADIRQSNIWPFFFLIFLTMFLLLLARKQARVSHIFLLAGLAVMGALMARNIPLFAIAAAPVLSQWAREAFQDLKIRNRWLEVEKRILALQNPLQGGFWPVIFGLGLALFIGGRQVAGKEALFSFDRREFPVYAADWLEANPQSGWMFNEFNWGGYLLYRLWPEQKVFLDSQTDFYGEALVREYNQAVTASPGWEGVLDRYEVAWAILPSTVKLADILQTHNDWEIIYRDETAIIARESR